MPRGKAVAGEPSQREMVKTALEELGNVGPTDIATFIKERYGREVKKAIISSYKSQLKSKSPGNAPAARGGNRLSGSIEIRDLTTVQELIRRLGSTQLISLVKTLSDKG